MPYDLGYEDPQKSEQDHTLFMTRMTFLNLSDPVHICAIIITFGFCLRYSQKDAIFEVLSLTQYSLVMPYGDI